MTTIPAPDGLAARAAYAMRRVPSADARRRSRPPAEPPAMGVMGGRESLSTHIALALPGRKVSDTLISPRPGGNSPQRRRARGVESVDARPAPRRSGVVLRVVVLDEHGRLVDPIVMSV